MEGERLPLEYTVRPERRSRAADVPLIGGKVAAWLHHPVRWRLDLIKWSGPAPMPQLTGEILQLLYLRRESRLRHDRRSLSQDRLTNDSGISGGAVCFSAGFDRTGYLALHVVDCLLRAASPALSCRCRTI